MRRYSITYNLLFASALALGLGGCQAPSFFQSNDSGGSVALQIGDGSDNGDPCEGQEFCDPSPHPSDSPSPNPSGDPNPPGGDPQPDPSDSPSPNPSGDPNPPGGDPQPNPSGSPSPNPSGDPNPPGGNPPGGNPPGGNPPGGNPPGDNPGDDPSLYPCPPSYHCGNKEKGCMLLCHIPPGKPSQAKTMCLPVPAAINGHNIFRDASKQHADYPGACAGEGEE
jgi:hypothetical protein